MRVLRPPPHLSPRRQLRPAPAPPAPASAALSPPAHRGTLRPPRPKRVPARPRRQPRPAAKQNGQKRQKWLHLNLKEELQMIKRTSDWLEKMSVASMAVGLFQGQSWGIYLGIACFAGSLYLTREKQS